MESLKRIREPLAWALIALAALSLTLQAAGVVQHVTETGSLTVYVSGPDFYVVEVGGDGATEISAADQLAAAMAMVDWSRGLADIDAPLLLALVAAVVACSVGPAVARARRLAMVAAWMATLTVGLGWGSAGFALLAWRVAGDVRLLRALLDGAGPVLQSGTALAAAVVLWALAIRSGKTADEGNAEPGDEAREPTEPEPAGAGHSTVWKPADATETVWWTDGAPGAPSLGAPTASEWAPEPRYAPASSEDWRPPPTA